MADRGTVTSEELISYASTYPGRIIPAVRIKGEGYIENGERYYQRLKEQMDMEGFGAMAEVPVYHAPKGDRAPEILVYPDDERVQAPLEYAIEKEWPFVVHIEFAAVGSLRDEFMAKFKALLVKHPEYPFVLNHMGQLDCISVCQLIEAHPNIYFITAASNPIVVKKSTEYRAYPINIDSISICHSLTPYTTCTMEDKAQA
ncbi:hypothetical protein ACFLTY_04050 [Chloroflexota bacterium]